MVEIAEVSKIINTFPEVLAYYLCFLPINI